MARWFDQGDTHTGWKDSTGRPCTDAEARKIIDEAAADWAKRSGQAAEK